MLVTNQPTWLIMCNSFVMLAAYSVVNRTASWTAQPYTTTIWFILSMNQMVVVYGQIQ